MPSDSEKRQIKKQRAAELLICCVFWGIGIQKITTFDLTTLWFRP
jgi:hypothetical protein